MGKILGIHFISFFFPLLQFSPGSMKLQIHSYDSEQVTTAFKTYYHTYVTESLIPYTYLGIILKVNTRNWTQKVPTIYSSLKLFKKKKSPSLHLTQPTTAL